MTHLCADRYNCEASTFISGWREAWFVAQLLKSSCLWFGDFILINSFVMAHLSSINDEFDDDDDDDHRKWAWIDVFNCPVNYWLHPFRPAIVMILMIMIYVEQITMLILMTIMIQNIQNDL